LEVPPLMPWIWYRYTGLLLCTVWFIVVVVGVWARARTAWRRRRRSP
jgi:hypothetical protein